MYSCVHTQAVIGIAFSFGFLLGPVIGAVFSVWGKSVEESGGDPFTVFQYPALFALTLALLDIVLLLFAFPETLPVDKRAQSLGQGMLSTLYLINPLSIFRFDAISKIARKGIIYTTEEYTNHIAHLLVILHRFVEPTVAGTGILSLPLSLFWPRILTHLLDPPALQLHQVCGCWPPTSLPQ